jgi:hypothetical protein
MESCLSEDRGRDEGDNIKLILEKHMTVMSAGLSG